MRRVRLWIIYALLAVLFLLGLTACNRQEEVPWIWPYHSTESFTGEQYNMWGYPDAAEQDYDNLIAYMEQEQEVYPTDAEIIIAYVRNTNPGKGFSPGNTRWWRSWKRRRMGAAGLPF